MANRVTSDDAVHPVESLLFSDVGQQPLLDQAHELSMTGLAERTAGSLLKALLDRGLLSSDTPQGAVRFGLPLHALRFYFPALWPEAEVDDGDPAALRSVAGS